MLSKTVAKFCGKHLGIYTKKEMVRIAEHIGRDLVDIQKSNIPFSKEIIENTVKKHAPKIKLNLQVSRNEVAEHLIKSGVSSKNAETCVSMFDDADGIYYQYLDKGIKCKGIFVPLDKHLPEMFSHEFEHQLFQENSFLAKFFPKLIKNKSGSANKIQRNVLSNIDLEPSYDMSCWDNTINNLRPGRNNLLSFLQNFDRLETPKRIKAYFTGMCRNIIHPKNKGAFGDIVTTRQVIQDEARAYAITDRILRYKSNEAENITQAGIFSELLNYTDEILKQEQKISILTRQPKNFIEHGCPKPTYELSSIEKLMRNKVRKR